MTSIKNLMKSKFSSVHPGTKVKFDKKKGTQVKTHPGTRIKFK